MIKILPYKLGSESARKLARALGAKRIKPEGRYVPSNRTVVVNWGNSKPRFTHENILNNPESVAVASNKLQTFRTLQAKGVAVPDFTTSLEEASIWQEDGYKVVVRHKLQAHSGRGIQVCRAEDSIPHAPLYTKYIKKDKEFRVHVFNGRVIDWSEKCKRVGYEPTDLLIRNHNNGWVFCRQGRVLSNCAKDLSIKAVGVLGLDFGAVDVIVREGRAWILEVNTAPGIEGSSLKAYVEAIRKAA